MKPMKSEGRLRYNPKLIGGTAPSMYLRKWLVIDVEPDIGRYYRHLYQSHHHNCRTLLRPSWAEHISVVRGEILPSEELWQKYHGESIEFEYISEIYDDGLYFWLPVICDRALEIREELGLPREPEYSLHITVGNCR